MRKNRKHGSAVRFVPALKAALLCMLLGGSAIGYVYQKNQIIELGKQIQAREKRLTQVANDNKKLEKMIEALCSTTALEDRVRKMNLGLVQPVQSQILTIVEVPPMPAPRDEQLTPEQPPYGRIAAVQ